MDTDGGIPRKLRKITFHPSSADFNEWSYASTVPYAFMACTMDRLYLCLEHDTNSTGIKVHSSLTYLNCCYTLFCSQTFCFHRTLAIYSQCQFLYYILAPAPQLASFRGRRKSEGNTTIQSEIPGTTAFTRCIVALKENWEFLTISVSLEAQVALNSIYPRTSYVKKGEQNQISVLPDICLSTFSAQNVNKTVLSQVLLFCVRRFDEVSEMNA
jgi:hypothetical protein